MVAYVWKTGNTGDWSVAANWTATPSGVPNANNAIVTISAAGTYTVTIAGGESYTANTITLNSSGADLAVTGTLTLGGTAATLTVTQGEFDLYGELVGGTVKAGAGGTLAIEDGATLDGVTWQAPLTFAYGQYLFVAGGLTVKTATGGTPGSIDMTAGDDALYVQDSETLNNATLNFGSNGNDYLWNYNSSGGTLTLGSGFTLEQSGGTNYLASYPFTANPKIVNAGEIIVTGGELFVGVPYYYGPYANSFTNSGSIAISGGGTVDLSDTTATNTGHVSIGAGSELVLGTGFSSTGTITIASGGTLDLTGTVTLSGLAGITNSGGTVIVNGTLALGGGTMTVGMTGPYTDVVVNGELSAGTVKLSGGSITLENSATLDGVTWLGTLTFAASQSLDVIGGLTVKTAGGATPGSIDMTAGSDTLYVLDTETLNNATLNFGGNGNDYLYNYDGGNVGQTLTLGSGFTIEQSGGYNYLSNYFDYAGDTIANAGKITVSGGDLIVQYGTFTNSGSIAISGGGTVDLSGATLTNTGHISIGAGSELLLGTGFTNTGSIAITSGGTLDLTGTVTLSEPTGITNSGGTVIVGGTLGLGGGTMTVGTTGLYNDVVVYGALSAGTVKLSGGSITLESGAMLDGVTWLGTLTFASGQSLDVIGGLTVKTAGGGTPGSTDMTAGSDSLYVLDTETLNNATLNFGSNGNDYLYNYDGGNVGQTLALGSGFTIEQSGGYNYLSNYFNYAGDTIANAGNITVTGGDLIVQGDTFTNSGSIAISGGGTVDLSGATTTNTGHISIGSGSELVVGTGFSNTGSITITSGGTLDLTGYVTLSELTGITSSGGTLVVDHNPYVGTYGTLDLGGGTLTVATTGLFSDVVVNGELSDGTVKLSGGSITLNDASLDGVTWLGTLTFAASQSLDVIGLTVKTATGGTPGSIDMTAGGDSLYVLDSETLNNATLNFGSNGGDSLINYDYTGAGDTLTLGSGFTVEQSGGNNELANNFGYTGDTIANAGKIAVTGGDLIAQGGTFTSSGSIAISGGGTVDLSHALSSNSGHTSVASGSELVLGTSFSNTGSITIASGATLDLTGTVTLSELTGITNSGGTLILDTSGTLDLGGGTMTVGTSGLFSDVVIDGVLADGTVKLSAGSITLASGATLGGVTWLGTLTFAASQYLYVYGGLTVKTATGGTPGSIDMTAGSASLVFEDSETLDNATLNFGSVGGDYINDIYYSSGDTLTLGSGFTIEQGGGANYLHESTYVGDGLIVNDGKIDVTGGDLLIAGNGFTTSGSIAISGSGTVDLSDTALTNNGRITVGAGSELVLGTGFANTGSITIASGGTLDLAGSVTLADLTGITNSGGTLRVDTNGTLDLGGGTMDVATTGLFSNTVISGTLSNGTVKLDGGKFTLASGATLDPITFLGPLTFTANQTLYIVGGLTVKTTSGAFPGLIDMTAGGDSLVVEDSETLDNATLNFGSAGGGYLDNDGPPVGTLTLGSGFTLEQSGGTNTLSNPYYFYEGVSNATVNAGKITVTGGDFVVQGGTFTTSGTIAISGGGTVDVSDTALTNTGRITVGAGSELVLGTGFSNTGSITIASGATLDLTGTVTLSELTGIANSGGVVQIGNGATLDLGGGTVSVGTTGLFSDVVVDGELSDGTVKLSGGSIALNGGTLNGVTWLGTLKFAASQALDVNGGLTVKTASGGIPGSIDMTAGNDALYVQDNETLNNATLNFGSNGGDSLYTYNGSGTTLTLGSGFTVEQSGGFDVLGSTYGANTVANAGKINVTGGELYIPDNVIFTNSGSITVSGGYININSSSAFTSTGTVLIGNGGTLEIQPATAANITYNDPAHLILDTPAAYTGTISGLMTGDTLQLDNESIVSAGISGTTMTVHLTGGGTLTYQTGPGLDGTKFSVSNGDLLTVLCFLPGTLIATPQGETPVERLAVGDMVRTASGAVRPIAWIGKGKVLATPGRRDAATPVVVSKGALGPNVPHHDLRVTKGHSLHIDDVLIPVEFLVNHRSIYWDDRAQEVTLYHIELETHDVLLANGAPAESYRDDGNRWLFQNANSGWDQPAKPPCAPVLTGGPIVDAAWRRLLDRAGGPTRLPLTQDAALALLVDGVRVAPTVLNKSMAVFILPRRPGELRLVSRSAVPLELGLARDSRELGVAFEWLAVRKGAKCRMVGAEDARLTEGFHPFEPEEGIRWTNGDALLPDELFAGFKGELEVAINLSGATSYVMEGELLQAA